MGHRHNWPDVKVSAAQAGERGAGWGAARPACVLQRAPACPPWKQAPPSIHARCRPTPRTAARALTHSQGFASQPEADLRAAAAGGRPGPGGLPAHGGAHGVPLRLQPGVRLLRWRAGGAHHAQRRAPLGARLAQGCEWGKQALAGRSGPPQPLLLLARARSSDPPPWRMLPPPPPFVPPHPTCVQVREEEVQAFFQPIPPEHELHLPASPSRL